MLFSWKKKEQKKPTKKHLDLSTAVVMGALILMGSLFLFQRASDRVLGTCVIGDDKTNSSSLQKLMAFSIKVIV